MIEEIKIDRLEELIHEMMIKIRNTSVTNSAEGNPIEIENAAAAPFVKCVSAITGSQDLNGYDKPWVGGIGKNKIPILLSEVKSNNTDGTWSGDTYSYSGVTFKVDSNSEGYVTKITVNASLSSSAFSFYLKRTATVYTNEMIMNGCPSGGGDSTYDLRVTGGYRDIGIGVTIPANTSFNDVWIVIRSGISFSNLAFYPMIRLATETDPTFEPYANICPITAYSTGSVEVEDDDEHSTTYATTFPATIYNGSEDLVNGSVNYDVSTIDLGSLSYSVGTDGYFYSTDTLSDSKAYGAYETCNAICSIAEKSTQASVSSKSADGLFAISTGKQLMFYITAYAGKTAEEIKTLLTGQKLAYELATPATAEVTVSNAPISSVHGYNKIESSTGEMEVTYITEDFEPLVPTA